VSCVDGMVFWLWLGVQQRGGLVEDFVADRRLQIEFPRSSSIHSALYKSIKTIVIVVQSVHHKQNNK
jgi:hypothetical protein